MSVARSWRVPNGRGLIQPICPPWHDGQSPNKKEQVTVGTIKFYNILDGSWPTSWFENNMLWCDSVKSRDLSFSFFDLSSRLYCHSCGFIAVNLYCEFTSCVVREWHLQNKTCRCRAPKIVWIPLNPLLLQQPYPLHKQQGKARIVERFWKIKAKQE